MEEKPREAGFGEATFQTSVFRRGKQKEMPLASYEEFAQDKDPEFLFVSTLWLTGNDAVAVR